jgi:hypothetical protein
VLRSERLKWASRCRRLSIESQSTMAPATSPKVNHQIISTGDTRSRGFPSLALPECSCPLNNVSTPAVVPFRQFSEDCAQRPRCRHKLLSIARFTGCVVKGVLQ